MLKSKEFSRKSLLQEWGNSKALAQFMAIFVVLTVNSLMFGQGNWEDNPANPKAWTTGYVGIGTDDPTQKLVVKDGNIYVTRTDGSAVKLFLKSNSTTESPVLRLADTEDNKYWNILNHYTNNHFRLTSYNGSEWKHPFKIDLEAPTNSIYVDPNGQVGIGLGNPSEQLEVSGTIYASDGDVAIHGKATDYDGIGLWGEALEESGRGVYGIASGESGYGVYGEASYWENGKGVYGKSSGKNGTGVRGNATNTGDVQNHGGYFTAYGIRGEGAVGVVNGAEAKAIVGYASNSGDVQNYGGHFQANGEQGVGVYGYASATDNDEQINYGGYFVANGEAGIGVYGKATWTGHDNNYGGFFEAFGSSSVGVRGKVTGDNAEAFSGSAYGDHGRGGFFYAGGLNGRGVEAMTYGDNGYAGYFRATGANGVGIYAEGGANGKAGIFSGNIECKVLEITGGSDLSESFDVSSTQILIPGMVVAIDPKNPGQLRVADKAYDKTVAGIISGAGGINPGMLMGQSGTKADGEHPVALSGRVYCYVDASNGAVQPGDLLTTSDTYGHAMKVTDHTQAQGGIIGKAMTSLEKGRGLVLVLVTLQ